MTTLWPFLLGCLALVLAWGGQQALQSDRFFAAALLFGSAAAIFLATFWRRAFDPAPPLVLPDSPLRRRRRRAAWLVLLLSAAAGGLAWVSLRQFYDQEPFAVDAWWLHLASVGAILAAAAVLDWASTPVPQPAGQTPALSTRATALLLGGIVLLALFYRLFRFDALPFGVWYDEAEHGLQAMRILESATFRPIFEGAINGPTHYLYLVALSFRLFGVSVESIRLVSVLLGVGAVLAGYLVGRELFDRRAGLLLACFLAVSSWAVTFSRFGMFATTSTPFFTLLTAGLLLRGLRTQRVLDFALAGLAVGLGLAFYTSFRLFVPVVALFLLAAAVAWSWRARRWPGTRFWVGLLFLVLVTAAVVAPLGVFAYKHMDIFWSRVEDTFLFADKTEAQRWPALMDNIRRHVLMFNWHGDPNGRHNLPGNPMLDPVAAGLLVLGVAYALRRVFDPRYLFLLLWLFVGLLGGILSLDFEAPQSLRANVTLGVAYVLAVVPLAVLLRAWDLGAGRYFPRVVWAPVAVVVAVAAALNFQTYFVRQANDFASWNAYSTPETIAARMLMELDPNSDAYVTAYFHGHPTLNFLARNARPYYQLATTDQLPIADPAERGRLLILNTEGKALYDEARRYYPDAEFAEIGPPFAGLAVIFAAHLRPEDMAAVQGLTGRYFSNPAWQGAPAVVRKDPLVDFAWPAEAPLSAPEQGSFSVQWDGALHAHTYGPYDLFLESPAQAELAIGEQTVLSGTGILSGTLTLAEGNHALRIRAVGAPGRIRFSWRPPDRDLETVPAAALYVPPVTANGLLGRYFPNDRWEGPEVMAKIDREFQRYVHVIPLPRPYTVEWTGKIAIPQAGTYRFGLESIDESDLAIDGEVIVAANLPNTYVDGAVELTAGLHDIRIRHRDRTDHTHINVYWTPPDGGNEPLPPEVLFPPQASYADVTLPEPSALGLDKVARAAEATELPEEPGAVRIAAAGFAAPRGIAVGPDGRVYVAAGAAGEVAVLAPEDGKQLAVIDGGNDPLQEPTDLAIAGEILYVADGGAARLRRFTLDGAAETDVPGPWELFDRARGLAVAEDGRLLIANTPGNRVAAVAPDGSIVLDIPAWPGEDAQPVDVAVGSDGELFVTVAGRNRLIRFDAHGQRQRSWELPAANSLDSHHLAVAAAGTLYLTEPESGRVLRLDATGEPVGQWSLGPRLGQPVKPVGIAVAHDGNVWVTDSMGGNVIVIEVAESG